MLTLTVTLLTVRTFWSDAPKADLRTILLFSVPPVPPSVPGCSAASRRRSSNSGSVGACWRPAWRSVFIDRAALHSGPAWRELVGILSGLMNGAFAIPGPPVVIYAMATQPDPLRARAMLITFFMASALAAFSVFCRRRLRGRTQSGPVRVVAAGDSSGRQAGVLACFAAMATRCIGASPFVVLYGIGLSTLYKGISGYGLRMTLCF